MVFSKKHSVRVGAAHRESQASVASGVLRAAARLFERCQGGPGGNASAVVRGKTRPDESTAQETHGGRRRQVTVCNYVLSDLGGLVARSCTAYRERWGGASFSCCSFDCCLLAGNLSYLLPCGTDGRVRGS